MLRLLGCRCQVVPCMSAGAFAVRLAAASVGNGEHGDEDTEGLDVFGGGEAREPVAGGSMQIITEGLAVGFTPDRATPARPSAVVMCACIA